MNFKEDFTYHVYNRSNEQVFYTRENYLFFIKKLRIHILPYSDIIAYCLMPNHFHLLINVKKEAEKLINSKDNIYTQELAKSIGIMLSSYTQAINRQQNRKGSLFSHQTKAKRLNFNKEEYLRNCVFYIHQNPKVAQLVDKIEDWEFSSFPDYIGFRNGTLLNKELAYQFINIDKKDFYNQSYTHLEDKKISDLYENE
ncbi:MAG: transposase [Bacteroidetes bacterium]|nr:transposase [Bacteroidota bacterium]